MGNLTANNLQGSNLMAVGLTATALGASSDAAAVFNPATLFGDGDIGAYFDPSDRLTLFQDIEAQTPVVDFGDPVALMLDVKNGSTLQDNLGVENNDNDFSSVAGWNAPGDWSIGGGLATITDPSNTFSLRDFDWTNTASKSYLVEVDVDVFTLDVDLEIFMDGDSSAHGSISSTGTFTILVHPSASGYIAIRPKGSGTGTASISRFSIRESLGNHAYRTGNTAGRPIYARVPPRGHINLFETTNMASWNTENATVTDLGDGVFRIQGAGNWRVYENSNSLVLPDVNDEMHQSYEIKSNGNSLDNFDLYGGNDTLESDRAGVEATATSEWVVYGDTSLVDVNGNPEFYGIASNAANDNVDILVRFPQVEKGTARTAFQEVGGNYDITENGEAAIGIYLDGSNDHLETNLLDLSGGDTATMAVSAFAKPAGDRRILNHGSGSGEMYFNSEEGNDRHVFGTGGTTTRFANDGGPMGVPVSLIGRNDISEDLIKLSSTNTDSEIVLDQGTGNKDNAKFIMGSSNAGGARMKGYIFASLLIDRFITDGETAALKATLESKAGL